MKLDIKLTMLYLDYVALKNPNEVGHKVCYIVLDYVVLKNPTRIRHGLTYFVLRICCP